MFIYLLFFAGITIFYFYQVKKGISLSRKDFTVGLIIKTLKNASLGIIMLFFFIVSIFNGPLKISNQNKEFIGKWTNQHQSLEIFDNGYCTFIGNETGRRSYVLRIDRNNKKMRMTYGFLPYSFKVLSIDAFPDEKINKNGEKKAFIILEGKKYFKKERTTTKL